jgi:hypothetical protein
MMAFDGRLAGGASHGNSCYTSQHALTFMFHTHLPVHWSLCFDWQVMNSVKGVPEQGLANWRVPEITQGQQGCARKHVTFLGAGPGKLKWREMAGGQQGCVRVHNASERVHGYSRALRAIAVGNLCMLLSYPAYPLKLQASCL